MNRVVAAVGRGHVLIRVADQFQISIPTTIRWMRCRWAMGDQVRLLRSGPPSVKMAALREHIRHHLEARPDAKIAEHFRTVAEQHGLTVSTATVSRGIIQTRARTPRVAGCPGHDETGRAAWLETSAPVYRDR